MRREGPPTIRPCSPAIGRARSSPWADWTSGTRGSRWPLLVEALTSGLGGHGRADEPHRWGASVFLQLLDPERFAGEGAFLRETSRLAELCRTTPTAPGAPPVRLPGSRALARKARQRLEGVELRPDILSRLSPWAERFRVPRPVPI